METGMECMCFQSLVKNITEIVNLFLAGDRSVTLRLLRIIEFVNIRKTLLNDVVGVNAPTLPIHPTQGGTYPVRIRRP